MKKIVYLMISLVIIFTLMTGCKGKDDVPGFSGPHLGQSPPGREPQLFMPGLISTHYINHCIGFLKEGRVCVYAVWEKGVFCMYEKDGRWTEPEQVPWQNEQGTTDFAAGPDGKTIYFQSSRPTSPKDKKRETNMWKVEWTGDGWTDPIPLPSPANTEEYSEIYPSVSQDGSVYYFAFGRPDARDGDIYRSMYVDGKYLEAERFPDPINTDYYEVDPFVAPDGSYLLFGSARPGGYGLMDLYVSFRKEDGSWTHPFNTGPELNPFCISTRMSVTPDGKYFFFQSRYETDATKGEEYVSSNVIKWGDYDIYWMSSDFINELRNKYMGKKSAVGKIAEEYEEKGIQSAVALLTELYNTKQDEYFFELSEFMILCGDMMAAGKKEDAEQLYSALLDSLPEKSRIMQGYAMTCIMNSQASKGLELIKEMWAQFPSTKSEDMMIIVFQLQRTSRKDDEMAVLEFVASEFPESGLAHFWLANSQEYYGNIEEAFKNCMKALELNPEFGDAAEMKKRLKMKLQPPKGDYFGQKTPGKTPEIFAPGFISTKKAELNSVFSPDGKEFYFSIYTPGWGCTMYVTKDNGDGWIRPEPLPFSIPYSDVDMCLTPDGTRMYFCSTRPVNGIEQEGYNIWYADRVGDEWSEAKYLDGPINSGKRALYPNISNNGNMFFQSIRDDSYGRSDVYYSKHENDSFTEPVHLGPEINTEHNEGDVLIAPDESYMIVSSSGRSDSLGSADLYISFKKKDSSWTKLMNMGSTINSPELDYCPMLSPDGKYFFFTSKRTGNGDIFWVDAEILNDFMCSNSLRALRGHN